MAEKLATLSFTDGTPSVDFPVLSGYPPALREDQEVHLRSGLSVDRELSRITYIDGDAGILVYCGYPIEQLAEHCDFLKVAYLILNGELPNPDQKDEFVQTGVHYT